MGDVLQKVLMPWLSRAVMERGYPYVGGPVARFADVRALATPAELVAAFELGGPGVFGEDPEFVDVLRFEVEPLMRLRAPRGEVRPWPTYPMGFLAGAAGGGGLVPVWVLERTRVPRGAEMWRIHGDGREELITRFEGVARGWRGARGYTPVTQVVGPRAEFEGREYVAEFTDSSGTQIDLVYFGEGVPEGFTQVRARSATRTVAVSECQRVHEVVLSARWQGLDARVLQPAADEALLLLDQPEAADVERTGAREVEPGYFEVVAPKSGLVDGGGVSNALR